MKFDEKEKIYDDIVHKLRAMGWEKHDAMDRADELVSIRRDREQKTLPTTQWRLSDE